MDIRLVVGVYMAKKWQRWWYDKGTFKKWKVMETILVKKSDDIKQFW